MNSDYHAYLNNKEAFQLPSLFSDGFDSNFLGHLGLVKVEEVTVNGREVSLFCYSKSIETVDFGATSLSKEELLKEINSTIERTSQPAQEVLEKLRLFKKIIESEPFAASSTLRGSVKETAYKIKKMNSKESEAEQMLFDVVAKGGSFKDTYQVLMLSSSIDKKKLKEKLQFNNNIFLRALQSIAEFFNIETNVGYSNRALKNRKLEDLEFIIEERLYGRVDENLVKSILSLPKEEDQNNILTALFISCKSRPQKLGGEDHLGLKVMMDILRSSPEGVSIAEELLLKNLKNDIRFNFERTKLAKTQSGKVVAKRVEIQKQALENPTESTLKALEGLQIYYRLDNQGKVQSLNIQGGGGKELQTQTKEEFLSEVKQAIDKKYPYGNIHLTDFLKTLVSSQEELFS